MSRTGRCSSLIRAVCNDVIRSSACLSDWVQGAWLELLEVPYWAARLAVSLGPIIGGGGGSFVGPEGTVIGGGGGAATGAEIGATAGPLVGGIAVAGVGAY